MPLNKTEQIMQAVQATVTGLVTTGNNVERDKSKPWDAGTKAALSLFMGPMEPPETRTSVRELWTLQVAIDIHIAATNSEMPTEKLNQIYHEVANAMLADYTLGGLANDIIEEGSRNPELDSGAEDMAVMSTLWRVQFWRSHADPSI